MHCPACKFTNPVDEALMLITEGLEVVERNGERFSESYLYRLKGDLLIKGKPGKARDGEQCLLKSLEIAKRQEAKSLELRAIMSLCPCGRRKAGARRPFGR
jgi:hypothetical protein